MSTSYETQIFAALADMLIRVSSNMVRKQERRHGTTLRAVDREDLAADAILHAWKRWQAWIQREAPADYERAAVRCCWLGTRDAWREWCARQHAEREALGLVCVDSEALEANAIAETLQEAENATEPPALPFVLADVADAILAGCRSSADISERLGISRSTAWRRRRELLATLREIDGQGSTEPDRDQQVETWISELATGLPTLPSGHPAAAA